MANLYRIFKDLIPESPLLIGEVVGAHPTNCDIALPDGAIITARGSAALGVKVFVRDGVIEGIASCTANPNPIGGTVTSDNGQARAELLPETVLDLISIAADANSEVRRTNICIDQCNEMKSLVDRLRNNKIE